MVFNCYYAIGNTKSGSLPAGPPALGEESVSAERKVTDSEGK